MDSPPGHVMRTMLGPLATKTEKNLKKSLNEPKITFPGLPLTRGISLEDTMYPLDRQRGMEFPSAYAVY